MLTPIAIIIAVVILFAIGIGIVVYNKRKSSRLAAADVAGFGLFGIEAIGGFSAGQITTLSTSGVPGIPYNISLFSGKTPAPIVIDEGILIRKKQWIRHGEVDYARIGMNRF